MKRIKIGLYGRCSGVENVGQLKTLIELLQKRAVVCIYEPFLAYLQEKFDTKIECERFTSVNDIGGDLICLLSAGGDGTFLEASQFSVEHGIPILGINFGRLGFLAQVPANEVEPAIEDLFEHNYTVEKRNLISVYNEDSGAFIANALNEVTIQRQGPAMISTTVFIDNALLSSYWSDGILVSTPTGSTGYSLSAGGPLMLPDTQNFIITPIAPHNLNIRPIVISDNSKILIKVTTRKGNAALSVDNRMFEIASGTKITVKKSQSVLNFIKLKNYNFFKTLHTKLNWGIDMRN
ncbi:MAG: NAD(+)/NADH kinase [Prevotellaceae bacterium]|jgi:NAD+ kinase|nr:NAD(+)/NADH kinase [Prevotellaceae bacterium]